MVKINLGYPKIVGTVRGRNVPEPWFWQTGYSGRWASPEEVKNRVKSAYSYPQDSDELGGFAYETVIPYLDPYDNFITGLGYNINIDNYKAFLESGEKFICPIHASEWNVPQWTRMQKDIPDESKFPDPRWKGQIPDDLLEALRKGQAFLLFYSLWEIGSVYPDGIDKFTRENNIPVSSIIVANPNFEQEKIFETISKKPHLIYWNSFADMPWFGTAYRDRPKQLESWKNNKHLDRSKKFLCLNRRWSAERIFLTGYLRAEHSDSSIISQGTSQGQAHEKTTGQAALDRLQREGVGNYSTIFRKIQNFYSKFLNSSVCISPDQVVVEGMDNMAGLSEDLQNSAYINIVTETCFPYTGGVFFTEKIYKPIWCLQPFILVAAPHSLEYLRSLGFQTFDRWWDESYDTVEGFQPRLEAICKLIDRLDKHPLEWFKETYKEMEEVLINNFNVYALDSVQDNYTKVLREISKIVK